MPAIFKEMVTRGGLGAIEAQVEVPFAEAHKQDSQTQDGRDQRMAQEILVHARSLAATVRHAQTIGREVGATAALGVVSLRQRIGRMAWIPPITPDADAEGSGGRCPRRLNGGSRPAALHTAVGVSAVRITGERKTLGLR